MRPTVLCGFVVTFIVLETYSCHSQLGQIYYVVGEDFDELFVCSAQYKCDKKKCIQIDLNTLVDGENKNIFIHIFFPSVWPAGHICSTHTKTHTLRHTHTSTVDIVRAALASEAIFIS